jgi:serum/glucocorticoid-regulated kinase 2
MYEKILQDPLVFGPEIGTQARSILTGLLTRDPAHRLGVNGAEDIKKHPFFGKHIDFKKLLQKKIQPPFKPTVASPVVRIVRLNTNEALIMRLGIGRL